MSIIVRSWISDPPGRVPGSGDRRGVTAALKTGLVVTGSTGLLARNSRSGILNLADAFDALKRTNFRYRQDIMNALLAEAEATN